MIQRVFFTGVPGSRWSGIAQEIEASGDYDTSDRTSDRSYSHAEFSGHVGAYFGTGMEFPASLDTDILDKPFTGQGKRLHKSHEWSLQLNKIVTVFPDAEIILVYRPDVPSFLWWKEAGGWDISYPNYDWYVNDDTMMEKIQEQNNAILAFAQKHNLTWKQHNTHKDVFIARYNEL